MYSNVPALLEHFAQKYADKTALYIRRVFKVDKFSYAELFLLAKKVGTFLASKNISKGDMILIWSPNSPEWVITFFGCLLKGVVVVPVNVHTDVETVEKYIKQTEAKLVFGSKYIENVSHLSIPQEILENLLPAIKDLEESKPLLNLPSEAIAELVYTSGTTGNPKGVVLTHENITASLNSVLESVKPKGIRRLLSVLPLSHIMEQIVGLFLPLSLGATIFYLNKINPITITKSLRRYRITHSAFVPQALRMMLDSIYRKVHKANKEKTFDYLLKINSFLPFFLRKYTTRSLHKALGGKLEALVLGSAPLSVSLANTWELLGIKITEGYGATETTGPVCCNTLNKRVLGTVGKPLKHVDLKLSDEGELLVGGPMVFEGYYKNKGKTDEVLVDGYYKTNDIGFFDDKGYLKIIGRADFRIVTPAGEKIYPEDVERCLNEHSQVRDSCVFGVNNGAGELVYASVLLRDRKNSNLEKIIAEVNSQLEERQKIMTYSAWEKDDFPRMHTLKIDRKKVSQTVKRKLGILSSSDSPEVEKVATLRSPTDKLVEIICEVCKISDPASVNNNSILVQDLQLDSLRRVALTTLIEEEFVVEVCENEITDSTTLEQLREIIKSKEKSETKNAEISTWQLTPLAGILRAFLRNCVAFPIMKFYIPRVTVINKQNIKLVKPPFIIIFNHVGHFDSTQVGRVLPAKIRKKIVGIMDAKLFESPLVNFLERVIANSYPVDKRGGSVKSVLELSADLLEREYVVMLSPEGAISPDGKLQTFKKGAAMLAQGTGVPVLPVKIEGYRKIYPKIQKFPGFPEHRGNITIKIGTPQVYGNDYSLDDITKMMFETIKGM